MVAGKEITWEEASAPDFEHTTRHAFRAAVDQVVDDAERTLVTALAHQVGNAVTAMPDAASLITKAASLVQHHDVWPLTSGNFLVGSQSDTVKAHLVTRGPWHCDCACVQYRQGLCSHIISAMLVVKLGEAYKACYN